MCVRPEGLQDDRSKNGPKSGHRGHDGLRRGLRDRAGRRPELPARDGEHGLAPSPSGPLDMVRSPTTRSDGSRPRCPPTRASPRRPPRARRSRSVRPTPIAPGVAPTAPIQLVGRGHLGEGNATDLSIPRAGSEAGGRRTDGRRGQGRGRRREARADLPHEGPRDGGLEAQDLRLDPEQLHRQHQRPAPERSRTSASTRTLLANSWHGQPVLPHLRASARTERHGQLRLPGRQPLRQRLDVQPLHAVRRHPEPFGPVPRV